MTETEFINDLMHHIIDGVNIPKVQVERAVNPVLSLFIESVLNKYFENNEEYSGDYKLISPEFPLKKENNQSTNIDYLLVNNSKNILVLFELKTDIGSLKKKQMDLYVSYKKKIAKTSSELILKDLNKIAGATKLKSKYSRLLNQFNSNINSPKQIQKILIIYLVPSPTKLKIRKNDEIDFVLSFKDLPEDIEHKYSGYWHIIREHLVQLDIHFETKYKKPVKGDPLKIIANNVQRYLSESKTKIQPISVQIGNTGQGIQPNYQVEFEDGSVKTFRFNGEPHTVLKFNSTKLSNKILWKDIKRD